VIALVFIFLHVATLRWRWDLFGWFTPFFVATKDGYPLATATVARALENNWVLAFYVIGAVSVIFHWTTGLWTAAISWGLTITPRAQRRWNVVCHAMGVVLLVFLAGALVGARTYQPSNADERKTRQAQVYGPGHHGEVEGQVPPLQP
jgi:succinate dehydrogenase / fumarate reductase cytochrome b subunit